MNVFAPHFQVEGRAPWAESGGAAGAEFELIARGIPDPVRPFHWFGFDHARWMSCYVDSKRDGFVAAISLCYIW